MALNKAVFKTRAISAVFFVLIMLAGILWNDWSFFLLFTAVHFGCWLEFQRLITRIDPVYAEISSFHKYGILLIGWCFMLNFTGDQPAIFGLPLHEIGWWIGLLLCFLIPVTELLLGGRLPARQFSYSALGLLYISLSLALMIDLYHSNLGKALFGGDRNSVAAKPYFFPLLIIAGIWINDTMAYICGSLFGKTPFSKISPKKTWEGTIGGILLAIVAVTTAMNFILPESSLFFWAGIGLVIAITATAGDLLESKLKRMANVKDSGRLMPGHGGFLDRFDSLLFTTPCVWIYLHLIY